MLIDWSSNFDAWLEALEVQADAGRPDAQERLDIVLAQLHYLEELKEPPEADTPTLRRVRQSRAYPVWRVSHPYRDGIAIRLIIWFPSDAPPVLVLFANDKASMGDVLLRQCRSESRPGHHGVPGRRRGQGAMSDTNSRRPDTEFVGTSAAAARITRLRNRPGAVARAEKIRAEMAETDRLYADGLAAIRRAADLTQVALAAEMGVAQSEISRIESRPDMLLSTLVGYLTAAGERPRVVVTVNGRDVELDLTALTG